MGISNEVKEKIEKSLFTLLKTISFEKVTVTMLIKEAGISHQTFYRYYTDKYDFALKLSVEKLSAFSLVFGADAMWKEIVIGVLYSMKSNASFFKRMFKSREGIDIVRESIFTISRNFSGNYMSNYCCAVWMCALSDWASHDFETSVDDIYKEILDHQPISEVIPADECEKYVKEFSHVRLSYFIEKAKENQAQ